MYGMARFGDLSTEQRNELKRFIAGKRVYDLGCGNGSLTKSLVELGPVEIVGVDKDFSPKPFVDPSGKTSIRWLKKRFGEVDEKIDIAFVSWPIDSVGRSELAELLRKVETVIYLGKNNDGTWCGGPGLFRHLIRREVLAHAPESRNTMTVYGEEKNENRRVTGEEFASFHDARLYRFEEVERESVKYDVRRIVQMDREQRQSVSPKEFLAGKTITPSRLTIR